MVRQNIVDNRTQHISLMSQFKGYSSERSIIETPFDTFRVLQNAIVQRGNLRPRKPYSTITLTSSNLTISQIGFFYFTDKDGEEALVYKVGSNVYRWDLNTPGEITLTTSLTGTKRCEFLKINQMVYMIGDFAPQKLNYDEILPQGLPTPGACSLALDAGTWLDPKIGNFEYITTWMRKNGDYETLEGNGDPSFLQVATITAALEGVVVTIPSSPPSYATHWRVYRRYQDTGGPFFLIAEESGGLTDHLISTTSIVDHGRPAYFNTDKPFPTRNTQQLTIPAHMAYWRNKLWYGYNEEDAAANGGRLAYSLTDSPDYIPSDNFFIVGDSSEKFVKLLSTETALIILKERSVWRIDGISEDDFILSKVLDFGAVESEANIVGLDQQTIYFINERGIWEASFGQQPRLISDQILADFLPFTIQGWSAEVDSVNNWIVFEHSSGLPNTFAYDPNIRKFVGVLESTSSSGKSMVKVRNFWGGIFATGKIALYNYTDSVPSGVAITFTVKAVLGGNLGDNHGRKKLFRNITIFDESISGQPTVSVDFGTYDKDLTPDLSLGTFNLNDTLIDHLFSVGVAAKNLQFSFEMNDSSTISWTITGLDLEFEEVGNW